MSPNPPSIRLHKPSPELTYAYLLDGSGPRPRHWPRDAWVTLRETQPGVVRMDMRSVLGRQRRVVVRLPSGFVLESSQFETGAAGVDALEQRSGAFELVLMLDGQVQTLPEDACPGVSLQAGELALQVAPAGWWSAVRVAPQRRVAWVALTGDPSLLASRYALPGGLGRLRERFAVLAAQAASPALLRAARELIAGNDEAPGLLLRAETLALQLLGGALLEAVSDAPMPTPPTQLSSREIEQLQRVRARLAVAYEAPPRIADLAAEVGSNPSKLMRGFKLLFGETVADCALRQRMETAHRLLTEERLSVSEVAYRVGYQHHSSFTYAFTRHFGTPPRALRDADRGFAAGPGDRSSEVPDRDAEVAAEAGSKNGPAPERS